MKQLVIGILSLSLLFPGFGERPGEAPTAESMELSTFRNTSVGGRLLAEDPQGDEIFFTITTEPIKGSLELGEDGSFVYTPREGKHGRDYFGYKAVDSGGNISEEATVIIHIEKQKKDVFYEDMRRHPEAYAAALLSERGLFTGEQIAGRYCFSPEKPVTRGEFLSICLCLSGKPILSAVQSTGCADDEAIPVWMKGYVVTASLCGIGTRSNTVFEANRALTVGEASALLAQTLELTAQEVPDPDIALDRAAMAHLLGEVMSKGATET